MASVRSKGTLKKWFDEKGFGFIASDEDNKEYFVHTTGLKDGATIREGDKVTFEVTDGDRGPKAINVALAS